MSATSPPPSSSSPPPSQPQPQPTPRGPQPDPSTDPTFRFYTADQATRYAAHRPGYAGPLLDHVLALHRASGGGFGTVLDVGTGTGQVVRDVAPLFDAAFGVDPGVEMIAQAEAQAEAQAQAQLTLDGSNGCTRTAADTCVVFLVAGAEDLDNLEEIGEGSVDLITAGMAAHWFDMPKFWAAAARVLKPGGSVALWTKSSFYCHPTTTPNAAHVQSILSHFEDTVLGPYALPQNKLSQNNYRTLPLPWAFPDTAALYEESSFRRDEWDVGGHLTDPEGKEFFGGDGGGDGGNTTTLAELREGMGTASMVTRWREAHPALVGTEEDCVSVLVEELKGALGLGGKDQDVSEEEVGFRTGMGTGLLFVKRARE